MVSLRFMLSTILWQLDISISKSPAVLQKWMLSTIVEKHSLGPSGKWVLKVFLLLMWMNLETYLEIWKWNSGVLSVKKHTLCVFSIFFLLLKKLDVKVISKSCSNYVIEPVKIAYIPLFYSFNPWLEQLFFMQFRIGVQLLKSSQTSRASLAAVFYFIFQSYLILFGTHDGAALLSWNIIFPSVGTCSMQRERNLEIFVFFEHPEPRNGLSMWVII